MNLPEPVTDPRLNHALIVALRRMPARVPSFR
jgi:hypothetical protein